MTATATLLVSALAVAQVPAQGVTMRATALTDLRVTATAGDNSSEELLPAGTDLTAGVDLESAETAAGNRSASARMSISTVVGPSRIAVSLSESTSSQIGLSGGGARAHIGLHRFQVEFRSPRPMRARLTVRGCGSATSVTGTYSGRVDVVGHGSVQSVPNSSGCFYAVVEESFDVVVDSTGLTAIVETEGGTFASSSLTLFGRSHGDWELELVPDPDFPCQIESYGESCGATLAASTNFDRPGEVVVSLHDASLPEVAALTLGSARASNPILGTACTLHHNLQVFLFPWAVDAAGRAGLSFPVPPIPGLSFKMQAATLRGMTVHATNGLDALVCH